MLGSSDHMKDDMVDGPAFYGLQVSTSNKKLVLEEEGLYDW
jgi:hypothetical protein